MDMFFRTNDCTCRESTRILKWE